MVIDEIMKKIWEPVTNMYISKFDYYMNQNTDEVFESIKSDLKTFTKGIRNDDYNENIIPTPGCPHKNRNGIFSGCSMCNWETKNMDLFVKIAAIRKKNKNLYTKVLLLSFEQNRGLNVVPSIIEEIATHDAFDESTFPQNAFDEFFNNKLLFSKKPLYGIVAARASNIVEDKVIKWKNQFRKQLMVGMGVEVSNEWIRNYWINKNTSDNDIKNALKAIKDTQCHITADILLGIPGLSNAHSMICFEQTCEWLLELDVDNILVSPLSRKEFTLQEFIYTNLKNNSKLKELNIVDGYLTSIPSIFMVLESLYRVLVKNPSLKDKLILSPQNFKNYVNIIDEYYKDKTILESEMIALNALKEIANTNLLQSGVDNNIILQIRNEIYKSTEYKEFLDAIEAQSKVDIKYSLLVLVSEISKIMWPESCAEKIDRFKEELKTLDIKM